MSPQGHDPAASTCWRLALASSAILSACLSTTPSVSRPHRSHSILASPNLFSSSSLAVACSRSTLTNGVSAPPAWGRRHVTNSACESSPKMSRNTETFLKFGKWPRTLHFLSAAKAVFLKKEFEASDAREDSGPGPWRRPSNPRRQRRRR